MIEQSRDLDTDTKAEHELQMSKEEAKKDSYESMIADKGKVQMITKGSALGCVKRTMQEVKVQRKEKKF